MPFKSAALAILLALAGCYMGDPAVHVAYEGDVRGRVDATCMAAALRTVAPSVRRSTYAAGDGRARGFAPGTTVTQFGYDDPTLRGYYAFDVAERPNGTIHYWHGWGTLGTKVSAEEQRDALAVLGRANRALAQRCGFTLAAGVPHVGKG